MKMYDANALVSEYGYSESYAVVVIGKIRRVLHQKGFTTNLKKGLVSDYMIYLYDETMLDIESIAEIKKAIALEEIAIAIKEKTLDTTSALKKIPELV